MHTVAYIDQALLPYFGSMINFIQFVEKRGPNETVDQNEEGEEALSLNYPLCTFVLHWQDAP